MLDPRLAEELRRRPEGRPVMRQRWDDLTFIHYAYDPSVIQKLLPPGLQVDVFPDEEGVERAWVGLVPFKIERLAFPGGVGFGFLETNVRTYVHRDGEGPGVWFFSLDAANVLACTAARVWYGLPYWHAKMALEKSSSHLGYTGRRRAWPQPGYSIETTLGSPRTLPQPGSLEFFLVERYMLYSYYRGRLWTGRVFHQPYELMDASSIVAFDQLLEVAKIPEAPTASVLFSKGVEVEVWPIKPV